jgi:hypothetical protein
MINKRVFGFMKWFGIVFGILTFVSLFFEMPNLTIDDKIDGIASCMVITGFGMVGQGISKMTNRK